MLTPETAIATVDTIDVRVNLVGAPDQETRWGEPFIAEKAAVHSWPLDGGAVWVLVSGRAILKNGDVGVSTRHCVYDLIVPDGHRQHDPSAPSWLVEALKAAGVTW